MWKKEAWRGHQPLPRSGCAGCAVGNTLVFFGGNACSSGENFLADTYTFDVSPAGKDEPGQPAGQLAVEQCTELEVTGAAPFAMDRHTAVGHGDAMWVFGGDRGWTLTNKLWRFSLTTSAWQEVATQGGPCARRGHTALKCEGRKSMLVFGGMVMTHVPYYLYGQLVTNNVSVNDTWELFLANDPPTWERRNPVKRLPPARRGHTAVLFEPDARVPYTRMYVFGGYCEHEDRPGAWFNDVWRFIVEQAEWQRVPCWGDVPAGRVGHGAARTNRNSFVVFGGGSLDSNENSLYECFENGLWQKVRPLGGSIPPSPRSYATFVTVGLQLFLHGGCNNDRELDCLYSLSLDFKSLMPRSLQNLMAEYIIANGVPYKEGAHDSLEGLAEERRRLRLRFGGRQ